MLTYDGVLRKMVLCKFGKKDIVFVEKNRDELEEVIHAVNECETKVHSFKCPNNKNGNTYFKLIKILKKMYNIHTFNEPLFPYIKYSVYNDNYAYVDEKFEIWRKHGEYMLYLAIHNPGTYFIRDDQIKFDRKQIIEEYGEYSDDVVGDLYVPNFRVRHNTIICICSYEYLNERNTKIKKQKEKKLLEKEKGRLKYIAQEKEKLELAQKQIEIAQKQKELNKKQCLQKFLEEFGSKLSDDVVANIKKLE